jgi:hypothetical protein
LDIRIQNIYYSQEYTCIHLAFYFLPTPSLTTGFLPSENEMSCSLGVKSLSRYPRPWFDCQNNNKMNDQKTHNSFQRKNNCNHQRFTLIKNKWLKWQNLSLDFKCPLLTSLKIIVLSYVYIWNIYIYTKVRLLTYVIHIHWQNIMCKSKWNLWLNMRILSMD